MNSYAERARFYNFEFNTNIDFELLSSVISKSDEPIAEIPCGSGRLLSLHQKHNREVFMIDIEPLMIEQLKKSITEQNLNHRIKAQIGDLKFWKSNKPIETVLIPRGGIQLLKDTYDLYTTLKNLHGSISKKGQLYIDTAKPWNYNSSEGHLLPEFMRFSNNNTLKGESVFKIDNIGLLKRVFTSTIDKEFIVVEFNFCAELNNNEDSLSYSSICRWRKITLYELDKYLSLSGFKINELYGDYYKNQYSDNSSRLICIAQKK